MKIKITMKTKYMLTLTVLGLLSLSACSNEEELNSKWQDNPQAVKFDASIQKISQARTNPADKTETQFSAGDKITVYSGEQTATYVKGESSWAPESDDKYIYWNNFQMSFKAHHPAVDTSNGFTVPTDQSNAANLASADYMTCDNVTVDYSEDVKVKLKMQRQMARVQITDITYTGDIAEGNPTITEISFNSKSSVGGTNSAFVPVKPMRVDNGYIALVAPVEATEGQTFINITITYNGNKTRTLSVKNTPKLTAGLSHEFTLKAGDDKVEMGEVSVNPWKDVTGSDLETSTDLEPGVNASTHKVTLKEAGSLDAAYLHEAFGSGTTGSLVVEGPANETDLQVIAHFCKAEGKSVNLNLNNLTGFNSLPANSFKDCTALTQITLPTSVTEIGDYALANTGLTEFIVPATVNTIGQGALANTGLTLFTIPKTVTNIKAGILSNCSNLIKVNLLFNKETAGVTYTYDANALQGVGTAGKEVTLKFHTSWKNGLSTGDEATGFTFLGGTFKKVEELTSTYATRFNDAGICIDTNEFLNNNLVNSVTYEALVNFNSFTPTTNRNNTIMGTEEKLLLRVGDAGYIGDNITQLVMQGEKNLKVPDGSGFVANTWYHLAMTYNASNGETFIYINGNQVAKRESTQNKSFNLGYSNNFATNCLSIGRFASFGYNGNRPFDGMMREVRIWNVVRTADEIRANMGSVESTTEGLKVYYKLDGSDISQDGKTVKNQVTNLADGTIHKGGSGSLTQVQVDPIVIP